MNVECIYYEVLNIKKSKTLKVVKMKQKDEIYY